jgi:hypothetical protein
MNAQGRGTCHYVYSSCDRSSSPGKRYQNRDVGLFVLPPKRENREADMFGFQEISVIPSFLLLLLLIPPLRLGRRLPGDILLPHHPHSITHLFINPFYRSVPAHHNWAGEPLALPASQGCCCYLPPPGHRVTWRSSADHSHQTCDSNYWPPT